MFISLKQSDYTLKKPPIFVCGVQRAGTTLLVKMLNKSDAIQFLPQETHLFPLLWQPSGKIVFQSANEVSEFLRKKWPAVNYGWTTAQGFLEQVCDQIVEEKFIPTSTEALLGFILKQWEAKQLKPIQVGEKTPAHIYYAEKLLQQFKGSKFVVMCRDPRAAALSELIKLQNNDRVDRDFSAFTFIVRWATSVKICESLSKNDKALFIRYEDLITAPKQTLQKVTNYLEITYHDDLLDVGVTNSSFQDKKQKGIQFNTQNLDRWKTDLPEETISLIEFHLKSIMKRLDYKLSDIDALKLSSSQLLKQRGKFWMAEQITNVAPSLFHHINRNKKYK